MGVLDSLDRRTELKTAVRNVPVLGPIARRMWRSVRGLNGLPPSSEAVYLGDHIILARVQGFKMLLPSQDIGITPHLILDGYWEPWVTQVFLDRVKPGMTVVDVGAHVGYYTLLAARAVGPTGRVHSFEPEPRNFRLLESNVDLAGSPWTRVYPVALADQSGTRRFFVREERHSGGHSLIGGDAGPSIDVSTLRLDDCLRGEEARVDVMKIDAEGAEPWIIDGMAGVMSRSPGLLILMEFSPDFVRGGGRDPREFLRSLQIAGFRIQFLRHDATTIDIDIERIGDYSTAWPEMLLLERQASSSPGAIRPHYSSPGTSPAAPSAEVTCAPSPTRATQRSSMPPPSTAAAVCGDTAICKICGAASPAIFALPMSKLANKPIPNEPDDCPYYRCPSCEFVFATATDHKEQSTVYDEDYWKNQDPDWHGRVHETLRLVLLANQLLCKPGWKMDVLDFGCGMGCAVETMRKLGICAWGTDMITPKFGLEYFLRDPKVMKFDAILACEVVEHFTEPMSTFRHILSLLKPGGVFAFQTAIYDTNSGREWWYLGPANGHISLYGPKAFDHMARVFKIRNRLIWNEYAGINAWQI